MNCLQHTIIQYKLFNALTQPHVHLHLTAVSPKVPQYLILSINVIYSSSHGILIHNMCPFRTQFCITQICNFFGLKTACY